MSVTQLGQRSEEIAVCIVSTHVDTGGVNVATPSKRHAAGQTSTPTRSKRSRFRHHHTSISTRIDKISGRVKSLKVTFLEECPFVGTIIDEGNNRKRSCPVYSGTIIKLYTRFSLAHPVRGAGGL